MFSIRSAFISGWLQQLVLALCYILFGAIVHHFITADGIVSILWPGSGLALGALLIGGRIYLIGVAIGALLLNALYNESLWAVFGITLANVVEAWLGHWLLTRENAAPIRLHTLYKFLRLISWGGFVASIAGALIGAISILNAGYITPEDFWRSYMHWWMGDVMGVALVTTVMIGWRNRPSLTSRQLLELLGLLAITFMVGQVVFIDWLHDSVGHIARGYWMFLFVSWIAIRQGACATSLAMLMIGLQALSGALQHHGFFADDIAATGLHNYWYYMLVLSMVGMAQATYVGEIRATLANLKVKDHALNATANAVVITDVSGTIEWVNSAFCKLTGFGKDEAYGRNPRELVKSGQHPPSFYSELWETIKANRVWHGALVNRRKDGSLYHEEMTITPMVNDVGELERFVAVKQDVSERLAAEQKLRDSELRFRFLLDSSPIAVRITPISTGQVVYCNEEYLKLVNLPRERAIGINPIIYYANWNEYNDILEQLKQGNEVRNRPIQLVIHNEHSKQKWALATYLKIDFEGEPAMLGWFFDITDIKAAEAQMRINDSALKSIAEGVLITTPDAKIISVNQAFTKTSGYTADEVIGRNPRFLQGTLTDASVIKQIGNSVCHATPFFGTLLNYRKDGRSFWNQLSITPIFDERQNLQYFIGVTRDVTEQKMLEDAVQQLAFYDALTKLPNRRLLTDRLSQVIAGNRRNGNYAALMVLDLDRFKPLNDTHGHAVGDLLLIEVAQRMSACVRETDTVARFGGDEFVVVLSDLGKEAAASAQALLLAEKIQAAISEPYLLRQWDERGGETLIEHHCSASIGVKLFAQHDGEDDELFIAADAAMYQAKEAGRKQIKIA